MTHPAIHTKMIEMKKKRKVRKIKIIVTWNNNVTVPESIYQNDF